MENLQSKELFSRNFPFISPVTQQKLSEIKVALIGVGLSSQVAEALVRLGIRKFKIWDNDVVSMSNLNRQAFGFSDLGKNKAEVTAKNLNEISSGLEIEVYNSHFKPKDLKYALNDVDIVVNSADFGTSLVYDINDFMQSNDKWCIQPLNLGFGGTCMVFGANTPSLAEMTGGRQTNPTFFIKNLLNSANGFNPSQKLIEQGDSLLIEGEKAGWFPQNIIATLITASLITWAIVMIVEGSGDAVSAPGIMHFEPDIPHQAIFGV